MKTTTIAVSYTEYAPEDLEHVEHVYLGPTFTYDNEVYDLPEWRLQSACPDPEVREAFEARIRKHNQYREVGAAASEISRYTWWWLGDEEKPVLTGTLARAATAYRRRQAVHYATSQLGYPVAEHVAQAMEPVPPVKRYPQETT